MKINKINLLLAITLMTTLVALTVVSAALTLNSPTGNIGGTTMFNVTVPESDSGATNFTCVLYAGSTLTANTTWTTIVTARNNTAGGGTGNSTNASFNSAILEDANNYQFNATCRNNSGIFANVISSNIRVDNTVPTAATSLTPTSDTDNSVTFSGTVVGRETTSCTLLFSGMNPGASSYTMTHSGTDCSYTHSSIPEGIYTWYVRASDETNTTDSSTQQTNVDVKTSAGKAALLASQPGITSKGGALLSIADTDNGILGIPIWIIVVAVILIVVVIVIKRK